MLKVVVLLLFEVTYKYVFLNFSISVSNTVNINSYNSYKPKHCVADGNWVTSNFWLFRTMF